MGRRLHCRTMFGKRHTVPLKIALRAICGAALTSIYLSFSVNVSCSHRLSGRRFDFCQSLPRLQSKTFCHRQKVYHNDSLFIIHYSFMRRALTPRVRALHISALPQPCRQPPQLSAALPAFCGSHLPHKFRL